MDNKNNNNTAASGDVYVKFGVSWTAYGYLTLPVPAEVAAGGAEEIYEFLSGRETFMPLPEAAGYAGNFEVDPEGPFTVMTPPPCEDEECCCKGEPEEGSDSAAGEEDKHYPITTGEEIAGNLSNAFRNFGADPFWCQYPIDSRHLNCLWYGGRILEVSYKGWTFILGAYGDVRASLFDEEGQEIACVRDKQNQGRFYEEMNRFIKDDLELVGLESEYDEERRKRLVLDNNNWFEILVDSPSGERYDTGWVPEDDDLPSAVMELLENMDQFIADYSQDEESAREGADNSDESLEEVQMPPVKEEDAAEFIGQLIDIFEDFLAEREVMIDNTEKDEAVEDGSDPDSVAIIYGTDYGCLSDSLEKMMRNWKVMQ